MAASDPTSTIAQCGYCLKQNENLEEPKLLPCGHIHCLGCLDGALEAKKMVKCPDCEFVLNDLIVTLPDAPLRGGGPQHMCDVCEKQPAILYCTHESCKKLFCQEHIKFHDLIHSDHSTITLVEFLRQPKRHKKRGCYLHDDKPLIFGCKKCRGVFCEDCDDWLGCGGNPHQLATIKVISEDVKRGLGPLRDKLDKKKDELSKLSKDADRALSEYGEGTEELLALLEHARDNQLEELTQIYNALKLEVIQKRKLTEDEIKKFKEEIVDEELSKINAVLQKIFVSLSDDHMVDLVKKSKETEKEIESAFARKLPFLQTAAGVQLVVLENKPKAAVAIKPSLRKIDIGLAPTSLYLQQDSTDLHMLRRPMPAVRKTVLRPGPVAGHGGTSSPLEEPGEQVEDTFAEELSMTTARKIVPQSDTAAGYGGTLSPLEELGEQVEDASAEEFSMTTARKTVSQSDTAADHGGTPPPLEEPEKLVEDTSTKESPMAAASKFVPAVDIGNLEPGVEEEEEKEQYSFGTARTDHSEPAQEKTERLGKKSRKGKRQEVVEEEFDRVYYEYLKIIHAREFTSKILDKFEATLTESEHPEKDQFLLITVKSSKPKEAKSMMDALMNLFDDATRSVISHSVKLSHAGDQRQLACALSEHIHPPDFGFIARLATKDDIRIIGSAANMEKDIQSLKRFISRYEKRFPAQPQIQRKQSDISLPNGTLVSIMQGDLTNMQTDAVVSSSGYDLSHQKGVSKAIALACGQTFQKKGRDFIKSNGFLKEGDTFVQPADGDLARNGVRAVIHAIAPLPKKGADIKPLLVKTIKATLEQAETLRCRTVAFPAICAGVMGVPITTCGLCYWIGMAKFSSENPTPHVKQICFVVDDRKFVTELCKVMTDMSVRGKEGAPDLHQLPGETQNSPSGAINNPQSAGAGYMPSLTYVMGKAYDLGKGLTNVPYLTPPSELGHLSEHAGLDPETDDNPGRRDAVRYAGAATGDRNAAVGDRLLAGHVAGGAQFKPSAAASAAASAAGSSAARWTGGASSKPPANIDFAAPAAGISKSSENECPICLEELKDPEVLPCSHKFCKECVRRLVTTTKVNQCPTCRYPFKDAEGKQPKGGRMITSRLSVELPGYERYQTIVISYEIPGGVQGPEHPHPGKLFYSVHRRAYLPDNTKGRQAERLLRKAFDKRLIFTVGKSVTTGQDDCVVWNDIHHKTNMRGGPSNYGYPDAAYLDRLIEDLSAKGICE